MRHLVAVAAFPIVSVPAIAAPCREGNGMFLTCRPTKIARLRRAGAKSKVAKDGTPGDPAVSRYR